LAQEPAQQPGPALLGAGAAQEALAQAFAAAGVQVDAGAGTLAFRASIQVRDELLEYLLVNPDGAVHESLFVTHVPADVLNAAFLALGLERGQNVEYVKKDPAPTEAEMRAGVRAFDVVPPSGDGVQLYASWREGDETYFFRIEDLVRDLQRGRTMRRHAWVYLGSRWVPGRDESQPARFAALAEGNLVCISFFAQGNTLLTGALPECVAQSSWLPNGWLLPPIGAEVQLIAARGALATLPEALAASTPLVVDAEGAEAASDGAAPRQGAAAPGQGGGR